MIPDWETNHLFLSDRLESRFPGVFADLRTLLNGVTISIIHGTSDIWCRDYMPIQLAENSFCQFIYAPDYLREYPHLTTPPQKCQLAFMGDYRKEAIILDGGNVVASRKKVILTEKIFTENPSIERPRLRRCLEEVFQAECIFIPKEPFDKTGHSDGVVRFVAEDLVLINDYAAVEPGYGRRLRNALEKKGLEVETLPMFREEASHQPGDFDSAVGLYINYLRVGDVVVMPGYGRSEDENALEKIRQIMPVAKVFQLPCRSLAKEGGVLNCISWTIRRKGTATKGRNERFGSYV